MAGASTELYSEVLAQVCLAYSIKNNSESKVSLNDGLMALEVAEEIMSQL